MGKQQKSLKILSNGVLEKIADDSFKEIVSMDKCSRPKQIHLYGANPGDLIKVMLSLQDKLEKRFKKRKKIDIYVGSPSNGGYSIDVGHYVNHAEVS